MLRKRVDVLEGTATKVTADVVGSLVQAVEIEFDWNIRELVGRCTCPTARSGELCGHIWATLLLADARGYLVTAAFAKRILLDAALAGGKADPQPGPAASAPAAKPSSTPGAPAPPSPPTEPLWRTQLNAIAARQSEATKTWPANRKLVYIIDAQRTAESASIVVRLLVREYDLDGSCSPIGNDTLRPACISHLPDARDREILASIAGGKAHASSWGSEESYALVSGSSFLNTDLASAVLPLMAQTGRCYLQPRHQDSEEPIPLIWDGGGPWRLELKLRREGDEFVVGGELCRDGERIEAAAAQVAIRGGLLIADGRISLLERSTPFAWLEQVQEPQPIRVPVKSGRDFLAALLVSHGRPRLQVCDELKFEEVQAEPVLRMRISPSKLREGRLRGALTFAYENHVAGEFEKGSGWFDAKKRRFLGRDGVKEAAARLTLSAIGFRESNDEPETAWELPSSKLPLAIRALLGAGWHAEIDGKVLCHPGKIHASVSSGVDWFELRGSVEYGKVTAQLPELLAALRRGDNMVKLSNGEYGMLPEEWLRRFGPIAGMGNAHGDHLRFCPSQAGLLDALLATQPQIDCDAAFTRTRHELRRFEGIEPAAQPAGFKGQLRDYQREGLGWMTFLQRCSLGGCLADDMGVGKTAQVLALLESRRHLRESGENVGPSLVVVPKSLVFNWKQEAERFTPRLRLLDYTGSGRGGNKIAEHDVVITTYGTLRRDVPKLSEIEFDYLILDEAQAIKNAATDSAKAVRLLRGRHRLAMSGTPVENHLGELWSLFEFLNPGMLGSSSVFQQTGGALHDPDAETRTLLAQALRPYILRRTKEQVARELPAKHEQTLFCEMEPAQRKLYRELRDHYRNALLKRIDTEGMGKAKIQVLEALLRLRQAACHPALIDEHRNHTGSAKLDALLEQLQEVLDGDHKALVFSQFTAFLQLVRNRLDGENVCYEYLDGKTRDRQAHVEHFQNDPDCRLFLISLKAGGLGLNLTAAEYVFLLDPWWNPAVEAQAVDRAHRIGQQRKVFAYRLIARDTVEEKVLELQNRKRELAAAIIGEDNSLLRDLRREDLELLLS